MNIKINDLVKKWENSEKAIEKFEDIISATSQAQRELYVGAVDVEIAESIESIIRFWNKIDEENNIPIEEREPIKLFVDSPGGSLVGCFMITDAIAMSKTPVWTINLGAAYSAGFFIFIAGHRRLAYPSATFLFHEGSTGGDDSYIDAHKFRNHADFYGKQLDKLKKHVLKYTKMTEEDYQKVKKDDYWLFAEEAIEQGMCDEIIKEFI